MYFGFNYDLLPEKESRSTRDEEARLVARIIELASRYGRYGYRRTTAMLRQEGWLLNDKRVRTHLEEGGLEGAAETAKERAIMA